MSTLALHLIVIGIVFQSSGAMTEKARWPWLSEFQDHIQTVKQQYWKGEGGQNQCYCLFFQCGHTFLIKMQFLARVSQQMLLSYFSGLAIQTQFQQETLFPLERKIIWMPKIRHGLEWNGTENRTKLSNLRWLRILLRFVSLRLRVVLFTEILNICRCCFIHESSNPRRCWTVYTLPYSCHPDSAQRTGRTLCQVCMYSVSYVFFVVVK